MLQSPNVKQDAEIITRKIWKSVITRKDSREMIKMRVKLKKLILENEDVNYEVRLRLT